MRQNMNPADFEKEIKIHIEARYPILWLVSFEERRVEKLLENLCKKTGFNYWCWSVSRGLYGGGKKKGEKKGRGKKLSTPEEKKKKKEEGTKKLFPFKGHSGIFSLPRVFEKV